LRQKAAETHVRNIFHNMGATTRAALARHRTHRPSSEPATKIGPLDLLVLLVRRRRGCRKPKAAVYSAGRTPEWLICALSPIPAFSEPAARIRHRAASRWEASHSL
jgi:hypothetical protein